MLAFSVLASNGGNDASTGNSSEAVNRYREKVVQCLHLGEYTIPGPHSYETMYHYLILEASIREDADGDIWALLGIFVNLFMRMGYPQ